jgi:ParB family chromosome partitioning protein
VPGTEALAESIEAVGLLSPIVIDKNRNLVVGGNRLSAYKLLGRATIPAFIRPDLKDLTAELATIDENLIRVELSPLERGEQLARRKVIYEQIHPEAKQGALPGKAGGGKVAKTATVAVFAQDTADKTGV